jgi:hypothetical protein
MNALQAACIDKPPTNIVDLKNRQHLTQDEAATQRLNEAINRLALCAAFYLATKELANGGR